MLWNHLSYSEFREKCAWLIGGWVVRLVSLTGSVYCTDALTDRGMRLWYFGVCVFFACVCAKICLNESRYFRFMEDSKYTGTAGAVFYEFPADFAGSYASGICRVDYTQQSFEAHFVDSRWSVWINNRHFLLLEDKEEALIGYAVKSPGWAAPLRLAYRANTAPSSSRA